MNKWSSLYILIVLILALASSALINKNYICTLPGADAQIKIDTVFDASGILDYYRAHISTPICEADKCYAVDIIFYWDLIGRFLKYDTIPGAGLTKLDHQPFQQQDYIKLKEILRDDHSILASYDKEELVRDHRRSEIDGFTGATINEIKENVIEGAVYSCYTLWHIAHGPTAEILQKSTKDMFNQGLVRKLVNMEDQAINYFLIDQFSSLDFMKYKSEILITLSDRQGYYIKNAIEKMPSAFVADSIAQSYFASHFDQLNYFSQVALLEKLTKVELSAQLLDTLRNQSDDRSSYRNELLKQLLMNE